MESPTSKKWLFRVVDPRFGAENIYRYQARRTISLGPVMVATVADKELPWLEAEVISENNYQKRTQRAPVDKNNLPDHEALQKERKADFIGISASITNAVPRAVEIIKIYKGMNREIRPAKIIVGGWHAGILPQEFLDAGADVVVHGEGEVVISELLRALKEERSLSNIPGISYREKGEFVRNTPENLIFPGEKMDLLPHPNFGLVRYAKIKNYPINFGRGCSGKCRFCLVRSQHRCLLPERFTDQIKVLISKGAKNFFLVDDRAEENLEGLKSWLVMLRDFRQERKIKKLDITLQCRLTLAEHPEILELMVEAGVKTVAIGFESPIPEQLIAMRKPINPRKMVEQAKVFKRAGIYVHMMMIFGYPTIWRGEKSPKTISAKKMAEIFWQFIKKVNPDTLQVLFYVPIPGTEDWKDLREQKRIYKTDWSFYDGTWVVFKPDEGIQPEELQKEGIKLMRKFYAYKLIWQWEWVSFLAHLLKVGSVTVLLPFLWLVVYPFKRNSRLAWNFSKRIFRNARRHFQASLIISAWLRSAKHLQMIIRKSYRAEEKN